MTRKVNDVNGWMAISVEKNTKGGLFHFILYTIYTKYLWGLSFISIRDKWFTTCCECEFKRYFSKWDCLLKFSKVVILAIKFLWFLKCTKKVEHYKRKKQEKRLEILWLYFLVTHIHAHAYIKGFCYKNYFLFI